MVPLPGLRSPGFPAARGTVTGRGTVTARGTVTGRVTDPGERPVRDSPREAVTSTSPLGNGTPRRPRPHDGGGPWSGRTSSGADLTNPGSSI